MTIFTFRSQHPQVPLSAAPQKNRIAVPKVPTIMPFQWRQPRVRPAHSKQSVSLESRKWWSTWWHSCFPRVRTRKRQSPKMLWTRPTVPRRRPPKTKSFSDQRSTGEKTPTNSPRFLSLFQERKTTNNTGGNGEEQSPLIPSVKHYDAELKTFSPSSEPQTGLADTYSAQTNPDERSEVEHPESGSVHPRNRSESLASQTDHCFNACPSETQGISSVDGVNQNGCTSEHTVNAEQAKDTPSCVSFDKAEGQKEESQGPEAPSRPREIVVVLSWDSKEKRTIKRRKRRATSPIRKTIFLSPRASASYLSTSSPNAYNASGSNVRRCERLSSRSSSGSSAGRREERLSSESPVAYWEGWHRQPWPDSDTDHADESEVCSCSSVASSRAFSPPHSVFFPSFKEKDRKFATNIWKEDQKRGEQHHVGTQRTVAQTKAVTPIREDKHDVASPLERRCPISSEQSQQGDPSARAPKELPSTSKRHKGGSGTGDFRPSREVACNIEPISENLQNVSSNVLEGPGVSGRDGPRSLHSNLLSSSPSASTTSSKQRASETLPPCEIGIVSKLQDTRSPTCSQTTSSFPASLRRNITSLFPFSRMAPPAGLHHRNTHSAPLCTQHSRFSAATQGQILPRLSLPSIGCQKPTRGGAPASTRNDRGVAQPPSTGAGALEHQLLINKTAALPFTCSARLSESCKSKLQALPLLSRVVKVSPPLHAAANRGRCVSIDGSKTRSINARTFLPSKSKNLSLKHGTAGERPFWNESHVSMGRQLSAVTSSSIIHPPSISTRQRRANETSATSETQKSSETEGVPASEVVSCRTGVSCSLPPTCDPADSTHMSTSSLCTLVSRLAVKFRKEVGKGERIVEKTRKSGKRQVAEPRTLQQGQQRQRELGRFFDPSSLTDLDTLYTSHGRALKAHNSSSSATARAPSRRTANRISAATMKARSLNVETEECTSPAASIKNFALATSLTDLQEEAPTESVPRLTSTGPFHSASVGSSSTTVGLVDSASNASRFPPSSSSPTHFHKVEQAQSNSAVQRTECDCDAGELRASTAENNSRSQINFADKQNAKKKEHFRTVEADGASVEPPVDAPYHGGAGISVKRKEVDERGSDAAEEAIREKQLKEVAKRDFPREVKKSECESGRRVTDKERMFALPPKQQIDTTPAPPPSVSLPANAADESGRAVLLGDGAQLASSRREVFFVHAAVQNPNCAVGGAAERNDGERAKLPCVSSPITQLLYSRRSLAQQADAPKDAAIPSAGAVSTCAAVCFAEDITDTARSLDVCEGGESLLAHQKAQAVCSVPSAAVRLERTGDETIFSTETLSHTERVLSAVGLGFTSVVEFGATALRSLLAAQFEEATAASLTNTNADNGAAGGRVSVLSSKTSYTCVPPSPSTTFTLQAGSTPELCEQRQQTSKQLADERDKDGATDIRSSAAPPCATIGSPRVRCDAARRTTPRSPVTTCVEAGTTTTAPHCTAVSLAEHMTSPLAATVAREESPIVGSCLASVTPVVTTQDEDVSAVMPIADDTKATPLTLSRFQSASFCSAGTPVPSPYGSSFLPVSCSSATFSDCDNKSATLPACVTVNSKTFDRIADRQTVAPSAEGAGQVCHSCSVTNPTGKAHEAAGSQKGKLATASQTDTLHITPTGIAAASINLTSSHIHSIGCPATSPAVSSSLPTSPHPPGLTEGNGIPEKFDIRYCPSNGGSDSQRGRKIFCCHRGSMVDKSSRPRGSSVTSSGGTPSTCSRSRSLSEVVQAGSRFSVVLLLRCLRPFTTKWDGPKKDFDSSVSLDTAVCSFGDPCPPVADDPCTINQASVQGRDMAISAEDHPSESGAENRVYVKAVQHVEAETQQTHAVGAGQRTAGAAPARVLSALIEGPAICSISKPSLEAAANEMAAMTAKSAPTAAVAGATDLVNDQCEELVRLGSIDSSSPGSTPCATSRERCPQCVSRRVRDSVIRRDRTWTPRGLTLPPTFPLLLQEGFSMSWPQCGAQSAQQQRPWQPNPQGTHDARQEKKSQQQRPHHCSLYENPEKSEDGQSRPQVQQDAQQDVQQHSKELEKLQHERQQVEEAQLHKERHAKQHTVKDQRETPYPQQQRIFHAHQCRCPLQTTVPVQRLPTRPSQLDADRPKPRTQERSCSRPLASTPPPLSAYKYEHCTQSNVGCPRDAPTNRVRRCTSEVLLPLSTAARTQAPQAHKAFPDSLRGDIQLHLRTSSVPSNAYTATSHPSLLPSSAVLRNPPGQPARSARLAVTDYASAVPHAFNASVSRIIPPCVVGAPAAAPPSLPPRPSSTAFPVPFTDALRSNQHFSTFPPRLHRTGMLLLPQQLQPYGRGSAQSANSNTWRAGLQRGIRQNESDQSSTMQVDPIYHRCTTIRRVWHDNGKSNRCHKPCAVAYGGEVRLQQQLDLSPGLSSRSEVAGNEVRLYTATVRSSGAQTAVEQHEKNTVYYSSVQRFLRLRGSQRPL